MWKRRDMETPGCGSAKTCHRMAMSRLQPTAYSLQPSSRGFALVMVLIVVSVVGVVGIAYMAASTLQAISSENQVQATRARYLAESAVHHGAYLLHRDASQMVGRSADRPMGPYYLDDSNDSYVVWAHRTGEVGVWVVTGQGRVGEAVQMVSARVFVGPGVDVVDGQTALGGGKPLTIPPSVRIYGPISVQGYLENHGYIDGDVSYSDGENDAGHHGGDVRLVSAESIPAPIFRVSDYTTYRLDGETFQAVHVSGTLASSSPLTKGHAATPENPAGVVVIDPPRGGFSTIASDTEFIGTIVVDGSLILDGTNIRLRAQTGFPAIVCNGYLYVTSSTDLNVIGMVVTTGGVRRRTAATDTSASKTRIRGPLVTEKALYDDQLLGEHEVHFAPEAGRLYDVVTGRNPSGVVRILEWYD